jgi:hypothetical protein
MEKGFTTRLRSGLLNYIQEGMLVLDVHGKPIGLVTFVQYGEDESADPITEFPKQDLFSLPGDEEMIDEQEAHLLSSGFVRVDGGLFVSDRFATPDQIALVTNDRIELNIPEDELISL